MSEEKTFSQEQFEQTVESRFAKLGDTCEEAGGWWRKQENRSPLGLVAVALTEGEKEAEYCSRVLSFGLSSRKSFLYALYAVELGFPKYEAAFPEDKTLRNAVDQIKDYHDNPTEEKKAKRLYDHEVSEKHRSLIGVNIRAGAFAGAVSFLFFSDDDYLPIAAKTTDSVFRSVTYDPQIIEQILRYGARLLESAE